jgi:hypothetical protein
MNLNSSILETLVRARTEQLMREADHARLVKAAEAPSVQSRKSIMMLVRQFVSSAPTAAEAPQLATQAGC